MTQFGYTLMCEQRGPRDLVREAELAEQAGFDFAVISDHFHPWLEEQGESPYAWSVLGAVAARTKRMTLMTMVTCPIIRYHPAIVAQKAATMALLCEGRFVLGLGAGENLNEHVVGEGWPPAYQRHQMLEEAVDIIRKLWTGRFVSYEGRFYNVQDARLYSVPLQPPQIGIAASGRESCELAAKLKAHLIATEPKAELITMYRDAGGTGACYGQPAVCWSRDEAEGRKTAHRYMRFAYAGWKVQAELPNPVNFEAASSAVTPEKLSEMVPSGPDAGKIAAGIQKFVDAGFDRVAILQAGPDQAGFIQFWERELASRLGARATAATVSR